MAVQVVVLLAACACIFLPVSAWKEESGHVHSLSVSGVLVPGQKWVTETLQEQILIDKVNNNNSTFAAFYVLYKEPVTSFPIRGEFDPDGPSIGWVVSYWNNARNDHAVGSWAGYVEIMGSTTTIYATRIISNGNAADTTIGFDRFRLQEEEEGKVDSQ